MRARGKSRWVVVLAMGGVIAGAWACGELAPEPGGFFPDGGITNDGSLRFGDSGRPFDDGFPFDDGSFDGGGFDGDFFDGEFFDGGGFDGDFFDGEFFDGSGFDGDFFDGEFFDGGGFDGEPPPDTGPPWEGGAPISIITGETPASLAIDDTYVYWENTNGVVLDCPLAGCPNNAPMVLSVDNGGQPGLESIAAGASTGLFLTSSSSLDSCAGGGCGDASSTFWINPNTEFEGGFGDDGGSALTSVISDTSNAYFTDGSSVYACAIGSTCPMAKTLIATDSANIGPLAVGVGEVFYVNWGSSSASIRAVAASGGPVRVVCKSSNLLWAVNAMIVAGDYVYFTTGNDSSAIYQCPELGGGTPTVFFNDESPYALAADGSSVYWTNEGKSASIGTCPIGPTCSGSRTVASDQADPRAIAANASTVFWTTSTAIRSAAK